ncbi:MAG: acetyl/propionyl/methylcrotonyl-CoA carboxylase subunit alpha [Gammaproteobacteria bacterium]|nr:acetyl/propionyl/methylcrotonyl-CoA carboxylase subunit alpha [Gammaproteobacteria bacterium]
MFKKILVANRGEIACRVFRTARRLGIATVAVYSEADADALHVDMADEAVCIGPAPAAESYLSAARIVEAALGTGADAVHPGYGFLSEQAAFVRALDEAGLVFIGPPADAIDAMGDKIASKRLAERAGVNTIPGHAGEIASADEAVRVARGIGYPVMLKASAGGGGKGMRIAGDDDACRDGYLRARSEAKSSFGDDRILIEKYIAEPRHIEIQVLADGHGNVIHLGERECSIQRRHQKVVEEAPSPLVDGAMREAMGSQAVALARAVGYRSAGTVEFVVDPGRRFYFLEMNTRLQVEHPVTEAITGLDLVELMIRIAAGEPLGIAQGDVHIEGWAIETRIYAEDPLRGFLPSSGRLTRYVAPGERPGVRLDTGVEEGSDIPLFYDPLMAKLVGHGNDRRAALASLADALDAYVIRGVANNVDFLARVVRHPRFAEGRLSTNFIDEEFPDGFRPGEMSLPERRLMVCVAACVHHRRERRAREVSGRMAGVVPPEGGEWVVRFDEESYAVRIEPGGDDERIIHDGESLELVSSWAPGEDLFRCELAGLGACVKVEVVGVGYRLASRGIALSVRVLTPRAAALDALMPRKSGADTARRVLAPMPGLLISLSVAAGDEVKSGQELAVVEAMKMENVLRADMDGKIAAILATPGQSLKVDQPILEFE